MRLPLIAARTTVDRLTRELAEANRSLDAARRRQRSLADQLAAMHHPPIFLNTLPKSGSVYIITTLERGLGTRFQKLGRGTFPVDTIDGKRLDRFTNQTGVSQEHLDASAYNLTLIGRRLGRLAIHLRDPRAAAFSWMHHLTGLMRDRPRHEYVHALQLPPAEYHERSQRDRMAWIVEHYFPACIAWMQGWIDVADGVSNTPGAESVAAHLTTYERFVNDADGYFADLLAFFEVPPPRFRRVGVEKTKATNFRKGQAGEWRSCEDAQIEAMTAQIPEAWFERFDWAR